MRGQSTLVATLVARLAVGALLASAPACTTPEQYAARADREVLPVLDGFEQAVLGDRAERVVEPAPAREPPPTPEPAPPPGAADGPDPDVAREALRLDLRTSLATAFGSSREFQNQRESLYLQGLDLGLVRYRFGPVLSGTVDLLWSDTEDGQGSTALGTGLGLSKVLPSGGTFSIAAGLGVTALGGAPAAGEEDPAYDGSLGFGVDVPLLRGAGQEVSHEALTQAERDMVYAVRDFELFREDFSIEIAEDFFDLVSRRQRLDNLEQNYKDAQFDANKAEALRLVDRNQDEDVFLARRVLIDAESNLLQARADYERAVDSFKIRLGLPAEAAVTISEEQPPFLPVALDSESAVTVALANRLDLQTAAERVADVERALRIARNGLLPDLDLGLSLDFTGDGGTAGDALPDTWTATAAMSMELPLDRQSERNAYRSAQIALDRSRRDHELLLDNVARDVRDQLRQLTRTEEQIVLQREQIEQEQRAVAVTRIRYEAGDVDNRDLIDARQSLVAAQNALVDLLAEHYISRLRLLRTLGLLFIDEDGTWRQ